MIETLDGIRETVNYKEIKGFKFYDNVDYESYPAHWHTAVEILMPLKSSYEVTCNNATYHLQEDDLLFINSGVVHGMSALEGERLIFQAEFSLMQPISFLESSSTPLPPVLHLCQDNAGDILPRIKELMLGIRDEYNVNQSFCASAIYSMLLELCVLMGRKNTGGGLQPQVSCKKQKEYLDKFLNICTYISDHCTEDLSLDDAAALAGFSKYHFTRLFKAYAGTSFYRYLNIKRIEHAESLLIDPEISITQVALQSGFSSCTSFIRMFKLIRECTPTEYRNLYEG